MTDAEHLTIDQYFTTHNRKVRVNTGTIGHVDHGKTTSTAAFSMVLSEAYGVGKQYKYDEIDNAPEEKARGITINKRTLEMQTAHAIYSFTDCPGHADYVKNAIVGMNKADFLILVVASDGVSVQTKEHVLLASKTGVKYIFPYINKCDVNEDLIELVKDEVLELLMKYKFVTGANDPRWIVAEGSSYTVVNGNPNDDKTKHYKQVILDFFDKIERTVVLERGAETAPFLAYIDSRFSIQGRGSVVTAIVEEGTLKPGEVVDVVGNDKVYKGVTITEIQISNKKVDQVTPGDNMAVLLKSNDIKSLDDLERGMALTKRPLHQYKKVKAQVYLIPKEEGGRSSGVEEGYSPQIYLHTGDFTATIELSSNQPIIMPGDTTEVILHFKQGVPLTPEIRNVFTAREGGKTVFSGVIVEYGDKAVFPENQGKTAPAA